MTAKCFRILQLLLILMMRRTGTALWSQPECQRAQKSLTRTAVVAQSMNVEFFRIRKRIILSFLSLSHRLKGDLCEVNKPFQPFLNSTPRAKDLSSSWSSSNPWPGVVVGSQRSWTPDQLLPYVPEGNHSYGASLAQTNLVEPIPFPGQTTADVKVHFVRGYRSLTSV